MEVFYFILIIPVTIILLIIVAFGLVYLYMGILQLFNAGKKENNIPMSGGLASVIISAIIIFLAIYIFIKFIWIW